ncbi:MAG: hypothetical protein CMF50_03050 [Legionellales bacterium]|nr:hypothetical protein [Legionellales bacterium]|tara:strand:+ start:17834 stop:18205 length:372 start_codon:yes stop_codon:yes gene_type:complete
MNKFTTILSVGLLAFSASAFAGNAQQAYCKDKKNNNKIAGTPLFVCCNAQKSDLFQYWEVSDSACNKTNQLKKEGPYVSAKKCDESTLIADSNMRVGEFCRQYNDNFTDFQQKQGHKATAAFS